MNHLRFVPCLWLIAATVCCAQQSAATSGPVEQTVLTGQQVADAVGRWGMDGGQSVLRWGTPYISVQNTSFSQPARADGTKAFSTGQLTFQGNASGISTLDCGMRVGLVPLWGSQVILDHLSVVNQCEAAKLESKTIGPESTHVGSLNGVSLWVSNLLIQSLFCQNCVLYVRQAEVSRHVYLKSMPRVAFPPIQAVLAPLLSGYPAIPIKFTAVQPYEILVKDMRGPGAVLTEAVVRAITHPTDPLLLWMRSRGLLMAPQFCNGTLLPPELANARFSTEAPAWTPANNSDFISALREAAQFTARTNVTWRPPPEIMLSSNVSLPASIPPIPAFATHVLFMGQFNDDPDYQLNVQLDLQRANNTLKLGPGAQLFIQQLTVTGLAQGPLPTSPSTSSAFPLAAVTPPPGTDPVAGVPCVWLHNVTLVLPPEDYLAVASIALASTPDDISRCLEADVTARATQLQPGIQAYSSGALSTDTQLLYLSSFLGWGVNATALRLVPSSPVPQYDSCRGTVTESWQCGRLSCPQLLGLVLGLVLGCIALAIGVLLVVCWVRRQRAAEYASSTEPGISHHLSIGMSTPSPKSSCLVNKGTEASSGSLPLVGSVASRISQYLTGSDAPMLSQEPGSGTIPVVRDFKQMVEEAAQQLGAEANEVNITGVLGTGSFGNVYRGVWRGLSVAVKTLVFEEADGSHRTSKAQNRAIMEAAIAASVGHRNLVCTYFHDIKFTKEDTVGGLQVVLAAASEGEPAASHQPRVYKLFLVQEYCHITLGQAVANGFFSPITDPDMQQAIASILHDIACGLDYLHKNSIVHGDLKPDNVLLKVEEDGTVVTAKLADFGLSTHLSGNATHVSNMRCGTPFYVAPEVLLEGHMSRSADVFSYGVIMWQCLTGATPYIGKTKDEFTWNPAFPKLNNCALSIMVKPLMLRCLARGPQKRPSAADIAARLDVIITSIMHQ